MKDFINYFIMFTLILFTSVHSISPKNKTEKYIPVIKFNGINFSTFCLLENKDYVYFSFNFDNKILGKNISYFHISTEQQYFNNSTLPNSIIHTFINLDADKISYSYIKEGEKYLIWKRTKIAYKSYIIKNSNFTNYYIQITKEKEFENENTLVIRIPMKKSFGLLSIRHIEDFPEYIKRSVKAPSEEIKKDINKEQNDTINRTNEDKKNNNSNDIYNPTNRNEYNKYGNYNRYNKRISESNAMIMLIGGALLSLWISLFILYFIVNRRKKSFIVFKKVENDISILYNNI